MTQQRMNSLAMEHTGDSANIAHYRGRDGFWCEALRSTFGVRKGRVIPHGPRYSITLYRIGEGEIGQCRYAPREDHGERLPDEVVSRLAKRILQEVS